MSCFLKKSIKVGLILGVVLAALKILFVGYDVDEQYAISMSYRFLQGDVLIKDMWEPHQTSAFLLALFMWPYYMIVGNSVGIVLYLRICGLLIHIDVCTLLYKYLMKYLLDNIEDRERRKDYSLLITGIQFLTLPKLMFLAEFSNMQVWFLLLSILFLLRYLKEEGTKGNFKYSMGAGFFMMLEVFTYPSTIMAFVLVLIFLLYHKRRFIGFVLPCVLGGALLGIYLLLHMNVEELFQYVPHIASDGSHATTWFDKIVDNLWSIVEILKLFGVYAVIAFMLVWLLRRRKGIREISAGLLFFVCLLGVTLVGQIFIWVLGDSYPNYPSVEYFFVLAAGVLLGIRKKQVWKPEFYLLVMVPLSAFAGVVLLTNHPILVSAPFLGICMTGVWVIILQIGNQAVIRLQLLQVIMVVWMVTLIFGKGFMVRMTGGTHHTIFDYVNIMKDGPAKGIIADYNAITRYKECWDMINAYIPENSKVFYAGENSDIYLMKELEVCVPSTISTPTFDEKIETYFEIHPNKLPEYVICDNWVMQSGEDNYLLQFISENCEKEPIAINNYAVVYKRKVN